MFGYIPGSLYSVVFGAAICKEQTLILPRILTMAIIPIVLVLFSSLYEARMGRGEGIRRRGKKNVYHHAGTRSCRRRESERQGFSREPKT